MQTVWSLRWIFRKLCIAIITTSASIEIITTRKTFINTLTIVVVALDVVTFDITLIIIIQVNLTGTAKHREIRLHPDIDASLNPHTAIAT